MATDIFEIKGANAELRIGEKTYKFADPKYLDKVLLGKRYQEHMALKGQIDTVEWATKYEALNKDQILMYLPSIEKEVLDQMGEFSFSALLQKVFEISQGTFGAVVEKVEGK